VIVAVYGRKVTEVKCALFSGKNEERISLGGQKGMWGDDNIKNIFKY
jgi:hypothetical protein